MSTEGLRARLIKAGYDEDEVVKMDRNELLSTYAEYLLSPSIPESPERAKGSVSVEELELKRQELQLKGQKEERLQREEVRRKEELQMQREMRQQHIAV